MIRYDAAMITKILIISGLLAAAALVIVALLLKEGRAAWQGEDAGD